MLKPVSASTTQGTRADTYPAALERVLLVVHDGHLGTPQLQERTRRLQALAAGHFPVRVVPLALARAFESTGTGHWGVTLEAVRSLLRDTPAGRVVLWSEGASGAAALLLLTKLEQRLGAFIALASEADLAPVLPFLSQLEALDSARGLQVLLLTSLAVPAPSSTLASQRLAEALRAAGCKVTCSTHFRAVEELTAHQRILVRRCLHPDSAPPLQGFGNFHQSECLPEALPRQSNSPREINYGLYAEQLNATPFLLARPHNSRSWAYRIRPSAQQREFTKLRHATLAGDFSTLPSDPNLMAFAPLPLPSQAVDFVDGLFTLGGCGSPQLRRGYAVHLYAATCSMEDRAFCNTDGDMLLVPELGSLTLLTELGVLDVAPGEIALLPRGLRFSVLLHGPEARGYLGESYGRAFELPARGPLGANGLADARHFRGPTAWYEDRSLPGFRITHKYCGELHEAQQDHAPYDVVAWHGNYTPYAYDLALFCPVGNARFDHGDPSVHTVLSAPLDEPGCNALDLVAFVPRWDVSEHTFRPPYFHRNAATEINGIVRSTSPVGSPFQPGCVFITPAMTPHGVVAASAERALTQDEVHANQPQRFAEGSLWLQFESALPWCLTPWAAHASHRIPGWRSVWGNYASRFSPGF